ncbi:MAG TPA: hypothetical protein VNK96_04475 [Fimbriimonadales bacterium]|nr:hypothetical protein [Fimbriimonadales bacterium]
MSMAHVMKVLVLILLSCAFSFALSYEIRPPKSAIVIQLTGKERNFEEITKLAEKIVRREVEAMDNAARPYWQKRIELGLTPPGSLFILPRIAVVKDASGKFLKSATFSSSKRGSLTLEFPDQGNDPGPFPDAYKQLLQETFDTFEPVLDTFFGMPFQGGVVKVYNKDAVIGDRDAVAGGIYFPDDGSGNPAIWFPVYNAKETAVVNFLHCLYHAYVGPAAFQYDAWSEGLARATTMETCRLNRSILQGMGLDLETLDLVISNTYDNSFLYSWYNQPPLGNPTFIAPNLKDGDLPPGGSLGGIFLMRYRQAGTAWAKFFAEYSPGFFASFLEDYYTAFINNPAISGDIPALVSLMQNAMDEVKGTGAKIEEQPFADWVRRQYILDTTVSLGRKMFVESIPIIFGLSGNDFGVFAIWTSYYETYPGGEEQLLSGTSFPIYWDSVFSRMFLTGQDDRVDFAAGFGSVTPNLLDIFGGVYYKATVELPLGENIARTILPAGAIATSKNPIPNNFYGTVVGFDGFVTGGDGSIGGFVRITIPGKTPISVPLRNGAFGMKLPDDYFSNPATGVNIPRHAKIEVILKNFDSGNETVLKTIFVNTWGTSLGLTIFADTDEANEEDSEGTYQFPGGLRGGVQMIGFPVRPFVTDMAQILGLNPLETLVARWRQDLLKYDMYPNIPPFDYGRGYYIRMPSDVPNFTIFGAKPGKQPLSVPMQVGWNQITNPFDAEITFANISVQKATESAVDIPDAIAKGWIDTVMFKFNPGAPDLYSGVPEGGTLVPADSFFPGEGVFVRVLATEGVTFTFRPGAFERKERSHFRTDLPHWIARLYWEGLNVEKSVVEIGYKPGANPGYDIGLDALLPPIWGGALQAQLGGTSPMFRDIRGDSAKVWKITLTGLHEGKAYYLRSTFKIFQGSAPKLFLYDSNMKFLTRLGDGTSYLFLPKQKKQDFYVVAADK